jgi:signal transduction histidine kinase
VAQARPGIDVTVPPVTESRTVRDRHEQGETARHERGFRSLLGVMIGVLSLTTLALFVVPELHFVERAPNLDLVMSMAMTLAALAISVLAWVRHGEGEHHAVYQAAAFFALFVGGALEVALVVSGLDREVGASLVSPGPAPLYLHVLHRAVAAILLLAGGYAALAGHRSRRVESRLIFTAPAVGVAAVSLLILLVAPQLPPILEPGLIAELVASSRYVALDQMSPPLTVSQLAIGVLLVWAALLYARLYERQKSEGVRSAPTGFLSVGLVAAAFSQLHYAVAPGAYTSLMTSWDLLRAVFYGVLLAGVAAGAREDLRSLHRANEDLVRYREEYARRIALDERARLAREVHDGLIQDLWLARLKHGQLSQIRDLPADVKRIAGDVDRALESALAEARQALLLVRPTPDGEPTFNDVLSRMVSDLCDRFGLDLELSIEGEIRGLPESTQAELLRIIREALNNVRKHADATVVRVRLVRDDGGFRLTVGDNGKGFDPEWVHAGFGRQSMMQRAALIDADLSIDSRPMGGTTVSLKVPLPARPQTAR